MKALTTGVSTVRPADFDEAQNGQSETYFVKFLFGPDNHSDYRYMGMVRNGQFMLTASAFFTL
jgi:hypothetical protein